MHKNSSLARNKIFLTSLAYCILVRTLSVPHFVWWAMQHSTSGISPYRIFCFVGKATQEVDQDLCLMTDERSSDVAPSPVLMEFAY